MPQSDHKKRLPTNSIVGISKFFIVSFLTNWQTTSFKYFSSLDLLGVNLNVNFGKEVSNWNSLKKLFEATHYLNKVKLDQVGLSQARSG